MGLITIILMVVAIIAALLMTVSIYFYSVGISRRDKDFLQDNPDLNSSILNNLWQASLAWMETEEFEEVSIKSHDGLTLHAYYLKAEKPTCKTVILAHGYSSQGKHMAGFAQYYHENLGFNVLMPDNRGHGQSEGKYVGFGWHDRLDYLKWINFIIERNGKDSEIVLYGISMGGGTVLMISGEELPPNVKCIISDCAYSSARDILAYHMKRMYKLPKFPILLLTSLICKLFAGYFFSEASAVKQVCRAKVPILFIHGKDDKFVPTEMVYPLYESCVSDKDLLLVPNAGHGLSFFADREGYISKVTDFINKYVL